MTSTGTRDSNSNGNAWGESTPAAFDKTNNTEDGGWGSTPETATNSNAAAGAAAVGGANDGQDDGGWGSTPLPTTTTSDLTSTTSVVQPGTSAAQATEDFAASQGWGDAPAVAETNAAAKATGWEDAPAGTKEVNIAQGVVKKSAVIPKGTKMSWAQIAR